ncbi:hypothetical protein G8764_13900 [Pseudomaricurvus alcaniphilus]|uniref:hypothetical protein n=1 Tax=Pseudomaricurvus alcaniphilus TaxID=1166482 RepID=UPI00140DF7D7|nr:hypothetical protein [Pseudomaricurvus alcaniphilus]NHN38396.1 hypothetical protein [Pseudomaricurvus alcaniphilus]
MKKLRVIFNLIVVLALPFHSIQAYAEIDAGETVPASLIFDDRSKYTSTIYENTGVLPVTVNYQAGTGNTVTNQLSGIQFFLRELNSDWQVINDTIVNDTNAIGTTSGTSTVEIPLRGLTPTYELPGGNFYYLFVKFFADDGSAQTASIAGITIQAGYREPSLSITNSSEIKNGIYANTGALTATFSLESGSGNTITNGLGGLKVYLRELTSNWSVVNDVIVYDESVIGEEHATSTVYLPLQGLVTTSELPEGNFYYLFAEFLSSNGVRYNNSIAGIIIDTDFDNDDISDLVDTDDDNDGMPDDMDPEPKDETIGAIVNVPFFQGENKPVFEGKNWHLVEAMSDEFNASVIDTVKWQVEPVGNDWTWIGRPPGLFTTDTISVDNGKLKITVDELVGGAQWIETPYKDENGNPLFELYQYKGAIIRSITPTKAPSDGISYYFETKMKANQTEMSSTFWLMSNNKDCTKKFEIDIQETVGKINPGLTSQWALDWDHIYHSNMIHRQTGCNESNQNSGSVDVPAGRKTSDRYFIYGAHWKSPSEIDLYLDGQYAYTVTHPVAFDQKMWIQMAIETYDWNPVPEDGGMVKAGTEEQRTTSYEYVRTFKLLCEGCTDDEEPAPVAPSLIFDDISKYKVPTHLTTSSLDVTLNVEAGTGHTIADDFGGVRVYLRELRSNWSLVKDVIVDDTSVIGEQTATSTVSISLAGLTPTNELPEGNFYFLFAQFQSTDGNAYNAGIGRLNIDNDYDMDGIGDALDSDDDNDGVLDIRDDFPNDAVYGVLGDFDGDQDVDRKDISFFVLALKDPALHRAEFDFNGDGKVHQSDVSAIRSLCTRPQCSE